MSKNCEYSGRALIRYFLEKWNRIKFYIKVLIGSEWRLRKVDFKPFTLYQKRWIFLLFLPLVVTITKILLLQCTFFLLPLFSMQCCLLILEMAMFLDVVPAIRTVDTQPPATVDTPAIYRYIIQGSLTLLSPPFPLSLLSRQMKLNLIYIVSGSWLFFFSLNMRLNELLREAEKSIFF